MRLGQLARKLAVRPTEIAEFLSKQNIQLEANSNTRIEDHQVIHLVKHFAPDMVEAIQADLIKEETPVVEEQKEEVIAEIETPVVTDSLPQTETMQLQPEAVVVASSIPFFEPVPVDENNIPVSEDGIIRAPKVELPGLKVLGKIEIPESKKKDTQPVEEEGQLPVEAIKQDVVPEKEIVRGRERRQPAERRKEFKRNDDQRARRNPIALQREREAEEARQKKEEAARIEKERRTLHYMKKVKIVTPVKANLFADEPNETQAVREEEAPTSWWGRFRKWLKS